MKMPGGVRGSRVAGAVCIAVAMMAAAYAFRRAANSDKTPLSTAPTPQRLVSAPARPYLLFTTMVSATFMQVALAPLGGSSDSRFVADLACQRVYFAGGSGVCLVTEHTGVAAKHTALIFDAAFRVAASATLTGVPSRARVSPDGRRVGVTVFEAGHSYLDSGFSTRTTILDATDGATIADLEQFTVLRNGVPFKAVDFNFWGVSFARDSNRFYATLATGGTPYLVEGNVDTRSMRIIREGIECPSLSPDNRRVAYKHRTDADSWRIDILDLDTFAVTPLTSEQRSVDDQVDWFDDDHIAYHITGSNGADVWKLRVDGAGPPEMLMPFAYSPSIVR